MFQFSALTINNSRPILFHLDYIFEKPSHLDPSQPSWFPSSVSSPLRLSSFSSRAKVAFYVLESRVPLYITAKKYFLRGKCVLVEALF